MSLIVEELTLRARNKVRLLGPLGIRLEPGARLGLIGESGSGKSLLGRALMGVLPPGVGLEARRFSRFGQPWEEGAASLWHRLAWVPQEAALGLHPFLNVGEHLGLLPRACLGEPEARGMARLLPLFERLRLPRDRAFLGRFPHQLSGGQGQRLMLAMALSCDPEFLILDEPTTALDPVNRGELLALLGDLHRERGLGYLWISHDLELLSTVSERVLALYGGSLLEAGPTARVLSRPRSPYVARLLSAARGEASEESGFLSVPVLRPAGCPFQPRCPACLPACADWGAWRGSMEDGFRCERPLGELPLQV